MLKKDIYNNCTQKNKKYIVAKCMYVLRFSLTSNTDEMLHDKIIEHAYIRLQPRDERGVKNPVILSTKSQRTPHHPRTGKRRKMCDVSIVRCTCIRAWDSYVLRASQGTKESHIHGIYGGIALLEHLRTTMTIHRDALLRARRAILVMHQNAPSGFLSFFLFLLQFLRIVTQRRPVLCIWDSSHCAAKQSILLQIYIRII